MALKDDILQLAAMRAKKAGDVLEAAYDLVCTGQLELDDFLLIQADAQAGYPYRAAETLERLLAVGLIKSGAEKCGNTQSVHA